VLNGQKRDLKRQVQRAQMEAELAKLRAAAGGGTASTPSGGGAGTVRTVELYGVLNGQTVPLTQAVRVSGNSVAIVPGARVMRGDGPGDGFGLGGTPGKWSAFVGESPASFGLPAGVGVLGSDGSRGYVLNAQFLGLLFGGAWQSVIS
jgi:hypothetical protein